MSVNLAIVRGRLSSPPELRVLASGRCLAVLQITARPEGEGGPALSVPVAAWDPPSWVEQLDVDDEVVAIGPVRRRFFRAGERTGSKTEVQAQMLVRAGDRRRVEVALRRLRTVVDGLAG